MLARLLTLINLASLVKMKNSHIDTAFVLCGYLVAIIAVIFFINACPNTEATEPETDTITYPISSTRLLAFLTGTGDSAFPQTDALYQGEMFQYKYLDVRSAVTPDDTFVRSVTKVNADAPFFAGAFAEVEHLLLVAQQPATELFTQFCLEYYFNMPVRGEGVDIASYRVYSVISTEFFRLGEASADGVMITKTAQDGTQVAVLFPFNAPVIGAWNSY